MKTPPGATSSRPTSSRMSMSYPLTRSALCAARCTPSPAPTASESEWEKELKEKGRRGKRGAGPHDAQRRRRGELK